VKARKNQGRRKRMEYKIEKKKAPGRDEVEVLGATFEEGKPEGEELGRWSQKLETREERLRYLQLSERYWYGKEGDWYDSEKRRKP
jgi:hypothetical protein